MSTGRDQRQTEPGSVERTPAFPSDAFDHLVSQIDDVFWLYDCQRERVDYVSPAYDRVWGRSAARLLADPLDGLNNAVVAEHREEVRRAFLAGLESGRFEAKYRIRLPDGSERWIHDRGFPIRDPQGRVVHFAGVARDFTERKLTQDRLRESEAFLRATLDALPAHIAIVDPQGVILAVNRSWRQFAECNGLAAPDHAVGLNYLKVCDDAVGPDAAVAREVARGMRGVLDGSQSELMVSYPCDSPDERRWFELRVARFETNRCPLLVAIHLDVTARRRAEEQAVRQQAELAHVARVATIGEMAAGIAHELNQPLSAIANYAEGCLDRVGDDRRPRSDLVDALVHIRNLAQSSGAIIRRLRSAARKSEPRRSSICLNAAVRETVELVRYELETDGVVLEMQLADHLPVVQGDAVQIQQVLLNLLLNAQSAVRHREQPRLTIATRSGKNDVRVSVVDNGPGFGAVAPDRMFESFYSSKPDGLGLGLAISRSIVEAHGGSIWAERVDGCSFFHFTVPYSRPDIASGPPPGVSETGRRLGPAQHKEATA
ncbi:MAG: Adaptive-response sensory-kinase SasA [Phycisphaerae bacterium]|nr:Adaptive-response sensory-kinase SasA [Phycisphaerae bacterium]